MSRTPEQITVASVMELLGGTFFGSHFCERHSGVERVCAHTSDCTIRCLWSKINTMLQDVLGNTSLQDLLSNEQELASRIAGKNGNCTESTARTELASVQS